MVMSNDKLLSFIALSLYQVYIGVLRKSNIIFDANDITYEVKGNDITIIIPKSIEYQEDGRRAKAKRVPIKALIAWGIKHRIPGINKYVYAIQTNIYKRGIKPKKVKFDVNQTLLTINLEPYVTDLSKQLAR